MGDYRKQNVGNMGSKQDDGKSTASKTTSSTSTAASTATQPIERRNDGSGSDRRPEASRVSSSQVQQGPDPGRHFPQPGSYNASPQNPGGPWAMGQMANALPDYGHTQSGNQQYPRQMPPSGSSGRLQVAGASTPAVVYQISQNMQFPPPGAFHSPTGYSHFTQTPYGAAYGQSTGAPPTGYPTYPPGQQRQSAAHPPAPFGQQVPIGYYYYTDPYGRPTGSPTTYGPHAPGMMVPPPSTTHGVIAVEGQSGTPYGIAHGSPGFAEDDTASRQSEQQASSAIPRGPPRKPKQSGHALWVGNLPPGATIGDLKDHFSRDAKRDIESVFLISKSNCAFVNYRAEEACTKAMSRFHDSRFQGVRLVCRLRKSSAVASGVPAGPAAMLTSKQQETQDIEAKSLSGEQPDDLTRQNTIDAESVNAQESTERASERFFIVKSLTHQDLEQSVRNGIWATQSHNEGALNKAFESADNVYLIFSANKSGEYFGYARMTSSILENAAEVLGPIHRTDTSETIDTPKTIPTAATELAPRGRIIDDSARGTIFWEAELSDDEPEEDISETGDSEAVQPQTFGKPFKIEWISTSRVPFYRTRGLRNPWNANREVKIARDGTELEPNVGKRLIQLFHRSPIPPHSVAGPTPPHVGSPTT